MGKRIVKTKVSLLLLVTACASGKPASDAATQVVSDFRPSGELVTMGPNIGSSVDRKIAQKALDELNRIYKSGCLKKEFLARPITSLHNVEGKQVKTKSAAWDLYTKNAPYPLDIRWYSKRGRTVGYTYVWLGGKDCHRKPGCQTETRVYSNTRIIGKYSAASYAAHLSHELSHQARAGGFVHWTKFNGSVPYEMGHAAKKCFKAVKQEGDVK